MDFCKECDFMLYPTIVKNEKKGGDHTDLLMVCRKCDYINSDNKNSCILSKDFDEDDIKKQSFINPYIYDDETLPIAEGIKCPNSKCPKANPKIKYIQYDNDNMKFLYICFDCYNIGNEHIW